MRAVGAALAGLIFALALAPASAAALPLSAVPQHELPGDEISQRVAADQADPLRFAVPVELELGLADGAWDEPAPGMARWRLRLHSADARSLSLRLDGLALPAAASLRLLGEDGSDIQGPFGPADNGRLWLPLVRSATVVLEVLMPTAARASLALRVTGAFHGFRDPGLTAPAAKGQFGDSENCNIDFVCPEGDEWRREGRAVVLLTVGNAARCTGTLVNNLRQDNRPLVLTANHCGIDRGNVASVRAYFNVQKSICGGSDDGPIDQTLAGDEFLGRDAESDFALIELRSAPPAAFAAYYAGWDAGGAVPQSGAGIHHPAGDDKKISLYFKPATRTDNQPITGGPALFHVDAWRIVWDRGVTEPGSSGSALWDQNQRVVGVLSGGAASCAKPADPDFFGRLDRAWNAQAEAGGPLKAFLDPDCSGSLALNGREAGAAGPPPPATSCPSSDGGGALPWWLLLGLGGCAALRRSGRQA